VCCGQKARVSGFGFDLSQFPSSKQLASWAGLCPGNHESAGKRLSGKTRKGSHTLRRCLCQAAWAITRQKKHYLAAVYHRMAARRGGKRAVIAVAHALLVMAYHMLKRKLDYRELGPDYFDRLNQRHITQVLVRRLERLGNTVILQSAPEPA
jgi:transposase